jgi:hypothetical protein
VSVQSELQAFLLLRERLKTLFPEEDDESLADTLSGESNLEEAIAALIRSGESDQWMIDGISVRMTELAERQQRAVNRIERRRDLAASVMERAELKTIKASDMTITLSARAGNLVVTDETLIPIQYWVEPEPPPYRLDKNAVKAALKANTEVPGASLSNGSVSITVRKR